MGGMRLGLSAGPFWVSSSTHRRRYHRHTRFSHVSYWLSGAFMLEMAFWMLVGEALLLWYAGQGAVWLYRWWRHRRSVPAVAAAGPVNPRLYHSSRR